MNGFRFAQSAKAQVDQLLSQSQLDRLVDPIEADRVEDQSLDQILANDKNVHISCPPGMQNPDAELQSCADMSAAPTLIKSNEPQKLYTHRK